MVMNNRSVYNNLSITKTGTVTMTNTDLVLNGSLNIPTGATLDNSANNRNIAIAGNWSNAGTFTAGTGTVTLNGVAAQNINGTTAFNNLTASKPSNVTLAGTGTTTVNGVLTLTAGNIISTPSITSSPVHTLALGLSATISGGSSTSFIAGRMTKDLNPGNFTFPLGSITPNLYRPAIIENSNIRRVWTVEYVAKDPTDPLDPTDLYPNETFNENSPADFVKVSDFEYWLVTPANPVTTADLTLSFNTGSYEPAIGDIGSLSDLRIARWNGTMWDLPAGAGTLTPTGSVTAGTLRLTNITTFSPFTFASLDIASGLPVNWLSFKAKRADNVIALNWKTAQEVNNEKFEIERSYDGLQFTAIGNIPSKGNSALPQEYMFEDSEVSQYSKYYYRIKQIDLDGKSSYSEIAVVQAEGQTAQRWVVYPNPVSGDQKFALQQLDPSVGSDQLKITLTAVNGIVLYTNIGQIEDLERKLDELVRNASVGIYVLQVSDGRHLETFKVVRH
jgi:hypothetical protein